MVRANVWFGFLVVLLGSFRPSMADSCKYSRRPGLMLNSFQDSSDGNFAGQVTVTDSNPAYGNNAVITLTNAYNVLGATGNSITVGDNGKMAFWDDGSANVVASLADQLTFDAYTATSGTGPRIGFDIHQSYAAAAWYMSGNPLVYRYQYSYQHILRTDLFDSAGNVVKSVCQLERIEALVDDCSASNYSTNVNDYGTTKVLEAVVLTTRLEDVSTGSVEHCQTVLAVTDAGETKIIFLYETDATIIPLPKVLGYINGWYPTAAGTTENVWQAACAAASAIHETSNCDCGNHMQGIYLFDTKDYAPSVESSVLNKECKGEVLNVCGGVTKPHYLRNRYCRQSVQPQRLCREDFSCEAYATTTSEFKVVISFRDQVPYDEVVFLNENDVYYDNVYNDYDSDPNCVGQVTGSRTVVFEFTTTTAAACGVYISGGFAYIAVIVRDSTDPDRFKDGVRVLDGRCSFNQLSEQIGVDPSFQEVPTTVRTISSKTVDFFVSSEYHYKGSPQNTDVSGTRLYLGQDLFLTACYDAASIQANAEAYGVWVSDCYVSNDPGFPAGVNTVQIVDNTGCKTQGVNEFFYLQQEFKSTNAGTNNNYEWCVSSGKFDAQRWINDDDLYFKCMIHFCYNQVVRDNVLSKCEDSCSGVTDASTVGKRRKRNTYPVTSNETLLVQTHIKVLSSQQAEGQQSGVMEGCATQGVAVPVLAILAALLLITLVLTVLMFVKLQMRMRKRV